MSDTNHTTDIDKEVQKVLSQDQDKITFEELPDQQSSPLNQAVIDKDNPGKEKQVEEPIPSNTNMKKTENKEEATSNSVDTFQHKNDAPEQEINEDYSETPETVEDKEVPFELPLSHAKQAADTVLGIANNVVEVGGGYFVKIRKHKEFYDFEEIIAVVEKQNDKNVQRIKLDKEDQILLRPLLIQVLKTKAQKLTPEQQLLGAILSIGMKKVQVGMEIRNENEMLVDRILDIIRAEKGYTEQEEQDSEEEEITKTADQTAEAELVSETADQQLMVIPPLNQTISPEQVMEVAVDDTETPN